VQGVRCKVVRGSLGCRLGIADTEQLKGTGETAETAEQLEGQVTTARTGSLRGQARTGSMNTFKGTLVEIFLFCFCMYVSAI
jgi:hypothetical protein